MPPLTSSAENPRTHSHNETSLLKSSKKITNGVMFLKIPLKTEKLKLDFNFILNCKKKVSFRLTVYKKIVKQTYSSVNSSCWASARFLTLTVFVVGKSLAARLQWQDISSRGPTAKKKVLVKLKPSKMWRRLHWCFKQDFD